MTTRSLFDKFISGIIIAAMPVVSSVILYLNGRLDAHSKEIADLQVDMAVVQMSVYGKTLTSSKDTPSLEKQPTNGERLLSR